MTLIVNCFFLLSRAQQPVRKGALETATISVPTVQCEQCKDRIEKYISREDGIQMVKVDYKHHTCKVTYIWDRTTIENIKTAIANIGYDAGDDPAVVAQVVLKAATSRTPKLRYPAGPLARQLTVLKKFAPAALLDKGIRKANKLTAAPKPSQVPQKVR